MRQFLKSFNGRPPATDTAVSASEKQLGTKLPVEYVTFVKLTNGGEGFIGTNAYVILWSVEELASMNQGYKVQTYVPGLLMFGSDGGGEGYGFDTRDPQWPIVQVPFVGMAWDLAQPIAPSFSLLLKRLHESG